MKNINEKGNAKIVVSAAKAAPAQPTARPARDNEHGKKGKHK